MNEVIASNASDVKAEVEQTNITVDELAARRMGELKKKAAPPQEEKPKTEAPETAPKSEDKEPKPEAEKPKEEEPKPKEKSEDVLSKVDLSKLTDEEITELAKRGHSGLMRRLAELVALRKQAEEKAQSLEEFVSNKQKAGLEDVKVESNPYETLKTPDEVTSKYKEVNEVIEWAEDVLDRAENLGGDDIAAVVDGKELTKAQVKESLRKARRAHDKYLPAQFKELQARETRQMQRAAFDNQARQELSWLTGDDNDTKKTFEAMIADPRLKKLEQAIPELAPQMGYILAHATNSMYARKSLAISPAKPTVKVDPPSSPSSSAANGDRTQDQGEKKTSELSKRYLESGRPEDFIAHRTAQLSKRKKL